MKSLLIDKILLNDDTKYQMKTINMKVIEIELYSILHMRGLKS